MKTVTIAMTPTKDSMQYENQKFFTQYGIGYTENEQERDDLVKKYGCTELWKFSKPCLSLRRKVTITDDKQIYSDWDILDWADGEYECSKTFGDSAFYTAISTDFIHVNAVKRANKLNILLKELNELDDIVTPNKFERLSKLSKKYNDLYDHELKSKKLFKKANNGTAPVEIIKEIRDRILAEYHAEENKINARIEDIKQEIKDLN
jgi:hypothetical protein